MKYPVLSHIAMFVADHLPSRVRAYLYADTIETLFDETQSIKTAPDKDGSYSMFDAVSAVRLATLKNKALTEGLKGTKETNNGK